MRFLIIGTHPFQTTGYSRVIYNFLTYLQQEKDIETSVFGIQKFTSTNDEHRNDISSNVFIWDVVEDDPEDFGFGSKSLLKFVKINRPDIIMIYNDANVIKKYIMNLMIVKSETNKDFKIVSYLDQICDYQDKETISYIYEKSAHVFCFTEYWKQNILKIIDDSQNKVSILRHGIHKLYNISNIKAKLLLGFKYDDFIFLNLNRNMSRKRPDITIMAFALFLKNTNAKNAYLFMPNTKDNNYDLSKIYHYYLSVFGLNDSYSKNFIYYPDHCDDDEINIIYNACDVGVNTCQAEGFGLCNYEHASLGKPQILSNVGGLKDFFNNTNSIMIEPKIEIFENTDTILGNVKLVDYKDVSKAMETYYYNKLTRDFHAEKCVEISNIYKWENECKHMVEVLKSL